MDIGLSSQPLQYQRGGSNRRRRTILLIVCSSLIALGGCLLIVPRSVWEESRDYVELRMAIWKCERHVRPATEVVYDLSSHDNWSGKGPYCWQRLSQSLRIRPDFRSLLFLHARKSPFGDDRLIYLDVT